MRYRDWPTSRLIRFSPIKYFMRTHEECLYLQVRSTVQCSRANIESTHRPQRQAGSCGTAYSVLVHPALRIVREPVSFTCEDTVKAFAASSHLALVIGRLSGLAYSALFDAFDAPHVVRNGGSGQCSKRNPSSGSSLIHC